ncbi:MAG: hypothetical protein A4E59_00155 [Syntrophorhabdus sp. PtaB.Bin027]|jgi:uncharacterized Zn finger protein|nr:MAG: hypothetical protein A4E59_00155 [Syntrophorhabdus sp. PtaB.Bin027]OQB77779.1 MAG: hypothetical protein BWX92_00660 [Deltaproteobacteria bacterium ADurb.Bin135]
MSLNSTPPNPKQIKFLIQGSETEPYEVQFTKQGNILIGLCTCEAAKNGMICKHRLNLLAGSHDNIVSDNHNEVNILKTWVTDSTVEPLLKQMNEAQTTIDKATKELKTAKKKLAQALFGRRVM